MRIVVADGAAQVAFTRDLDKGEAGVLPMVGAEAAVLRAAFGYPGAESARERARLVVGEGLEVHVGVGAEKHPEQAVGGAGLLHEDAAVAFRLAGTVGVCESDVVVDGEVDVVVG